MQKAYKLMAWGLLPFLAGYAMDFLIINMSLFGIFIECIIIYLWGMVSYKAYSPGDSVIKNTALMHIPALVVALLLVYQELHLGRYWMGFFGQSIQMFYFPLLTLGKYFMGLVTDSVIRWPIYIGELIAMIVISIVGGWIRKKRENR